ncbi:MAG: twin-arginine translocase TatA/TatE family subunit [Planctomycetes bacterium]|nr:twin-arginine translocase TatA/TatE family subunit [Planctomycetota bacterium]
MFAFLGNIGFGEIVVIAIVGLILFGERLPEVAKSLGKNVSDLNKSLKETKDSILNPDLNEPINDAVNTLKKEAGDINKILIETKDAVADESPIDKAPDMENRTENTGDKT